MVSMYGDPIQEQKYNEWKKSIMRVVQANPLEESRKLPSGSELVARTIFNHLSDVGFTLSRLELMVPQKVKPQLWTHITNLYGVDVCLDETGRIQFIDENNPMPEDPLYEHIHTMDCEHGFVVRDVEGDNRFLCRECNQRFPRHPALMEQALQREEILFPTLSEFRNGAITFTEAINRASLSLDDFVKATQAAFPPKREWSEVHTL